MKGKVEGSKRAVVIVAIITAVSVLGNEMLFVVMPIYWKFFGLTSLWQIGVLLSANRLIRIPINSLVGWCYEKISKRNGLLIAVFAATVSTYSYGILKGFWLLLMMRVLWGIAWSFLRLGGYLTVMSNSTRKTSGHFIGLYNGIWGLGALFGMLIGGLFTDLIGIQTITTLFAVLGLCSIPFVILYVPNEKHISDEPKQKEQTASQLNRKRLVRIYLTGTLVAFVVYGIFTSTLSKLVEYQFNENVLIFSYSIGVVAVSGVLQSARMGMDPFLAPLIGKWSDQKFGRIPMLLFALSIGVLCLVLLPLNQSIYLFATTVLVFQVMSTILITSSDSLAIDLSSEFSSVKMMTNYTLFVDVGAALGPLLSYLVIDFIGITWLYWLTAIILICLFILWVQEFRIQRTALSTPS